jgi:hypothetical protein
LRKEIENGFVPTRRLVRYLSHLPHPAFSPP